MSIKELSAKFAMPERTVYYQIAKNASIRTKKQGRSKLANVADFAKVCGRELQGLQELAKKETKNESQIVVATSQSELQGLQNKYEYIQNENQRLEKYNSSLNKQVNDYALAFTEEKSEKKELLKKYDDLQSKYHQKIEGYAKRYYLVIGIAIALGAILLLQLTPYAISLYPG